MAIADSCKGGGGDEGNWGFGVDGWEFLYANFSLASPPHSFCLIRKHKK